MKKLISLAITLVMLLSLLPAASAADPTPGDFGWGSDGTNWSYWTATDAGNFALTDANAANAAGANGRVWKSILVDTTFTWFFDLKVDPGARAYISFLGLTLEAGVSADGAYWIPDSGVWLSSTDGYVSFEITRENGGDLNYKLTPTGGSTYTWTKAVVTETSNVEIGLWNSNNNGFAIRNMTYTNTVAHYPNEFGWSSDGSDWSYWTATDAGNFSLLDATAAIAAGANARCWKDILVDTTFTWSFDVKVGPSARLNIAFLGLNNEFGTAEDGAYWIPEAGAWMAPTDGYINVVITRENGGDLNYSVTPTGGSTYTWTKTPVSEVAGVELGMWNHTNNGFTIRNMTYTNTLPAEPEPTYTPGDFGWNSDGTNWDYWTATDAGNFTFLDANAANAAGANGRVWKDILVDSSFTWSFDLKVDPSARVYVAFAGVTIEAGTGDTNDYWIPQTGVWLSSSDYFVNFEITRYNGGNITVKCTPTGGSTYTWTMETTSTVAGVEIGMWNSNNNGFTIRNMTYAKHEHSYTYVDNNDGTHTATCTCGDSSSAEHCYENGVCVCGAEEEVRPDASLLVFKNKTLSLQSYIALNVTVEDAVLADYDSWYVTFECYDHLTAATVTETVEGVNYSTDRQLFEYKVSSYQMTDEITVTVYGVKDGVTYKGEVYTESVENFVLTRMEAAVAASTDMATLYANLLTYGAKAQTYLGYNTAALADANLGDYASYVTTTAPTAEDLSAETSNGLTGATKDRLALGIAASVQIQLRIVLDSAYDVNNVYGVLSYERNGETVTQRIEGADFTVSGSKYILIFDAITAVDGRAPVSITIYDANGTAISETWTYSISSYLVNGGLIGDALATMEAVLNYFDAAAKVFS